MNTDSIDPEMNKSSFSIAEECTTRRRILAGASTNQGPGQGDVMLLWGLLAHPGDEYPLQRRPCPQQIKSPNPSTISRFERDSLTYLYVMAGPGRRNLI